MKNKKASQIKNKFQFPPIDSQFPPESPRLDEITIVSRVIKKFGERGGRPVIFLLRQKYFLRAVEFVLGDKIFGRNL